MRRLVVLLGCTLIATVASAEGPAGRVLKIERPRSSPVTAPLLCEIKADLRGTCIGRAPRLGETVVVVDDSTVVAEVEIKKLEPYSTSCDVLWNITTEVRRGNVGGRSSRSIGVADPTLQGDRVHKMAETELQGAPSGNPDEKVMAAIDRDGDRQADIVLTAYKCDTNGAASSMGGDDCIDVWGRDIPRDGSSTGKMKRTSQSRLGICIGGSSRSTTAVSPSP